MFGYFTNAINNADVSNISNITPWNSTNGSGALSTFAAIAIITTSNATLAQNMIAAFQGSHTAIFTESLPQEISGQASSPPGLYVNKSSTSDTFGSLIRLALPQSTSASNQWTQGSNILVYRIGQPPGVSDTFFTPSQVSAAIYPRSQNNVETTGAAPHTCANPVTTNLDGILQYIGCQLQTWSNNNTSPTGGHFYSVFQSKGGSATVAGPSCIVSGINCAGGTQDTDAYRTFKSGVLQNQYPIFAVGVLHSASSGDPNPNATPANNAAYTGISAADYVNNTGVADAADPNATYEYLSSNPVLTGSAKAVLTALHNPDGSSLYSSEPSAVQNELNNLYIHAFYRQDSNSRSCTQALEAVCAEGNIYTTFITNGSPPAPGNPAVIPDSDPVLLTERGYLLPPPETGTNPNPTTLLNGAAAGSLESPYIVCDTAEPQCAAQ